jgi:hypothetical protein
MALNLPLAVGMIDVQVNFARFDADLGRIRQRLAALPSSRTIAVKVDRSAATAGINLLRQQLNSLQSAANVAARGSRAGRGGVGGGGTAGASGPLFGLNRLQRSGIALQDQRAKAEARVEDAAIRAARRAGDATERTYDRGVQAAARAAEARARLEAKVEDAAIRAARRAGDATERGYDRDVAAKAKAQARAQAKSAASLQAWDQGRLPAAAVRAAPPRPAVRAAAGGGGGPSFLGRAGSIAGGIAISRAMGMAMQVPTEIAGGMFDAARKAADLGESLSKVNVSFGPAAKGIVDKVDQLADRFGVVKKDALEAAANFGLMGMASGQTKEQAAALGTEFVQMGLDIASFHNISNEEAFAKLRSGLAGEIEPLRTIGILLSEDAVQARALQMGLVGTKAEATHLTQQQKVTARVALIREQMGPAAGDLERTAGSTANLMRKMAGDWENSVTEFGKELEGALRSGMTLAGELAALIKGATGKEAPAAVGELVKAGVDATRTTVSGAGPTLLERANVELGRAMSKTFGFLGLGENFLGVADTVKRIDAEQEAQVAAATGMPLEAGPVKPEELKPGPMQANAQAMIDAAIPRDFVAGGDLGTPGLGMARRNDVAQANLMPAVKPFGGRGGTTFAIKDTEKALKAQFDIERSARATANARGQDDAGLKATKAALTTAIQERKVLQQSLREMRSAALRPGAGPGLGAAGLTVGPGLLGKAGTSSIFDLLGHDMGDVGPGLMEKMAKGISWPIPLKSPTDAAAAALAARGAVPKDREHIGVAISGEEMLRRFQEGALKGNDDILAKQLTVQEKTLTAVEMLAAATKAGVGGGIARLE